MIPRRLLHSLALWLLPLAFVAILFIMRAASLPPTELPQPGTVSAATTVIYALVGLSLWWMGRAILGTTGALLPALLAQTAPLLSRIIPKFGIHPPEPFLIIAVALLVAALMPLIRQRDERRWDRAAALAGIAMALGIACNVHFVLLGVVPLLLLDRRRLTIYGGVGAAALVVFVAPTLPSWEFWVDGINRMILGSGGYGDGPPTVAATPHYPRTVFKLFASKVIFSAVILASLALLAAYFRLRRRGLMNQDRFARLLAGTLLAQVLVILSVAKQPATPDLIPALLLTGPALAALWSLSRPLLPARIHPRVWGGVLAAVLVLQMPQMALQTLELRGW